jgi:hypothetical protein
MTSKVSDHSNGLGYGYFLYAMKLGKISAMA